MTHYACTNPACPRRSPVAAAEPPTCYTCGGGMAAVVPAWTPSTPCEVGRGVIAAGRIYQCSSTGTTSRIRSEDFNHTLTADDLTAALVDAIERATAPFGAPAIIGFEVPEPTPEQRARREIGPIIVTVPQPEVTMAELKALQRDLQAEILRVLTTTDRVPDDKQTTSPRGWFGGADSVGDEHSIEILPGVFR